jgi:hypothetical protein
VTDSPMPHPLHHVELEYVERRLLTGTVGEQAVEITMELPVSTGTADGSCGEAPLRASWHIASNYNASEQPASLEGTLGDEAVTLAATMRFRSSASPLLVSATVSGWIAGEAVAVEVRPGADYRTVLFDGHLGLLVLAGSVSNHDGAAHFEGEVGDRPVTLTARSETGYWISPITIRGRWAAQRSLCLLVAAGLVYFV